jgi:hypothetical protein
MTTTALVLLVVGIVHVVKSQSNLSEQQHSFLQTVFSGLSELKCLHHFQNLTSTQTAHS